jgi:anthranilate synthase component 1
MVYPNKEDYIRNSKDFNLIPVYSEVETDFDTPLTIFQKTSANLLLESVESGENVGRYSIIGIGKKAEIIMRGRDLSIIEYENGKTGNKIEKKGLKNPLEAVRKYFQKFKYLEPEGLPPFFGGGIGYLGYECAGYFENIPMIEEESAIPDGLIIIPRVVLIYDSVKRTTSVVTPSSPGKNPETAYEKSKELIDQVYKQLSKPLEVMKRAFHLGSDLKLTQSPSLDEYRKMVTKCLQYIKEGDIIQAVLSRKISFDLPIRPFELYRKLRILNPSPYLYYLDFEDFKIIGSSPEVMVRVQDRELLLKPIAGTNTRGRTIDEDENNVRQLKNDPKERAEHIMLVDLGRNDLGKVSEGGSVEVIKYMDIEKYSHVMHIVSTIKARLAEGMDIFDVIAATFPAGTLSGAPKIRAMEIISELEGKRRGPYGGMIFNIGFNQKLDSCITIRTLVIEGNRATVQAGAGIVADSDPDREYVETENKALALIDSVMRGSNKEEIG